VSRIGSDRIGLNESRRGDADAASDELFTSYRTPAYKLHLFETPTSYRFVLLSDPSADSLRFVLRQLYTGPFVDYVVRNPVVQMDSRMEGVDNDQVSGVTRHRRTLDNPL
jgi:hypothetical protein